MSKKIKKRLILNSPYLMLGLLFTKLPEAWRHTSGADFGEKILGLADGFSIAFAVPFPSFYPTDLLIGLAILRFISSCTCKYSSLGMIAS